MMQCLYLEVGPDRLRCRERDMITEGTMEVPGRFQPSYIKTWKQIHTLQKGSGRGCDDRSPFNTHQSLYHLSPSGGSGLNNGV